MPTYLLCCDDDEFRFNDASTQASHLRQNCILILFDIEMATIIKSPFLCFRYTFTEIFILIYLYKKRLLSSISKDCLAKLVTFYNFGLNRTISFPVLPPPPPTLWDIESVVNLRNKKATQFHSINSA